MKWSRVLGTAKAAGEKASSYSIISKSTVPSEGQKKKGV